MRSVGSVRRLAVWRLLSVVLACAPLGVATARQRVVVALGDSITAGYRVTTTYPSRLGTRLGETVINEGVGGETSSGGLNRIESVIATHNPTHILIFYGANDVNRGYAASTVTRSIGDMVSIARRHNVIPIVATMTPYFAPRASTNAAAHEVSRLIRNQSSSMGYLLADLEAAFGSRSSLVQSDGYHANDSGAQVIADTFYPLIGRPLPLTTTLLAPSGVVTTRRPLFQWAACDEATWYAIRLLQNGVVYHTAWTESRQWTPTFDLPWNMFQWDVQGWNPSGLGVVSTANSFHYSGADAGVAGNLLSLQAAPLGGARVRYSWMGDYFATDYHVWIGHQDGTPYKDFQITVGRRTDRVELIVPDHPMGAYLWWVQGSSLDGAGPFCGPSVLTHGLPIPLAPVGSLTEAPRKLVWDDRPSNESTWYHLQIRHNDVAFWDSWVPASATTVPAAVGQRAFSLPDALYFPQGQYEFLLCGWNALGLGPTSTRLVFTLPARIPAATVPVSPVGSILQGRRPTFVWQAVQYAEWYQLWIDLDGTKLREVWVKGTAQWTPTEDLPLGAYRWWVRPWAVDGLGGWSSSCQFSLLGNPPGSSTPYQPAGFVAGTRRPVFTWSADAKATWYHLWVSCEGVAVAERWMPATTWTPDMDLAAGTYLWWVQTWNPDGLGPWSGSQSFQMPAAP